MKKCDWIGCVNNGKFYESYKGLLYFLCLYHRRTVNRQNQLNIILNDHLS